LHTGNAPTQTTAQVGFAIRFDGQSALSTSLKGASSANDLSFGGWGKLDAPSYVDKTWILVGPGPGARGVIGIGPYCKAGVFLQCVGGTRSAPLSPGYHHAVCTSDPATLVQHFYVDGTEVSSGLYDQPAARLFLVGGLPAQWPTSSFFNGAVDELFLASQLLTQQQVQQLMGLVTFAAKVKDFRVEQPDANTAVLYNDNRQPLHLRLEAVR